MAAAGFEGVYTNKAGKTTEGSATFWRRSRFAAAARRDLNFRDIFRDLADAPDSQARRFLDASKQCLTSPACPPQAAKHSVRLLHSQEQVPAAPTVQRRVTGRNRSR